MKYKEDEKFSEQYKKDYLDGLQALIEERESEGSESRSKIDFFSDAQAHRENLRKMLGWPLYGYKESCSLPEPTCQLLSEEDGYKIYRMSFEFLKGIRIHGLFFKHDGNIKRPFAIVQHGGAGTPELISGVLGDTSNYNDMAMRIFREDVNVFAPQLLLWKTEKYGAEYDRVAINSKLRRVGSSIAAVEIFAIMKIFDYFEKQPYTKNLAMVGLSYGGFYTLYTHALDTRIKAAISCSFFNDRQKYAWHDWSWDNAAYSYSDAEVCCLTYPRKLWIEVGDKDELFDSETARLEYERFKELSSSRDSWIKLNVFDGNHEFIKDDSDIKEFIKIISE